MTRRLPLAIALLTGSMLTGCASAPLARSLCESVLHEQAQQWNRGDLPGFVDTYWPGSELTFLGSSGLTRGQKDLLARYESSYPTAEARGELTFQIIDFRTLGADHALLLGRYDLDRREPDGGFFSLVLARHGDSIRILHDHTSREEPTEGSDQ